MQFAILPERQRPYQVKCKNKAELFWRKTCLKWYLLCNLSILKIYCLTDSTSVIYEKKEVVENYGIWAKRDNSYEIWEWFKDKNRVIPL